MPVVAGCALCALEAVVAGGVEETLAVVEGAALTGRAALEAELLTFVVSFEAGFAALVCIALDVLPLDAPPEESSFNDAW